MSFFSLLLENLEKVSVSNCFLDNFPNFVFVWFHFEDTLNRFFKEFIIVLFLKGLVEFFVFFF